jgi:LuxR family maltose regulon positive regulatory protein
MARPILSTKLFIPVPAVPLVARPRLFQTLDAGRLAGVRLALVTAPAGFGKSTLVSAWMASRPETRAWYSLDEEDNAPDRFLAYLISAIRTALPNFGSELLNWLSAAPPPVFNDVVDQLINELAGVEQGLILALDDYHHLHEPVVHACVERLIDHLPSGIMLVIITRVQPPLPIPRLRAHRELIEIRQAELKFSMQEAGALLNDLNGLQLAGDELDTLEQRTEGWVVGLQLAALALQASGAADGNSERRKFVSGFSGTQEYVVDYLLAEVLDRQGRDVQQFLLETSVLERMCAELCAAITGRTDSEKILDDLWRRSLFLIPLDAQRTWVRYHHLFADLLRARLKHDDPQALPELYRKASAWFESQGLLHEGMHYAQLNGDPYFTSRFVERTWVQLLHMGEIDAGLRWLAALPVEIVQDRPILASAYAWALCLKGQPDGVEAYLHMAEKAIEGPVEPDLLHPDEDIYLRVRTEVAIVRAFALRLQGQLEASIAWGEKARELAPGVNSLLVGNANVILAHAYRELGRFTEAIRAYREALPLVLGGGNLVAGLGCYTSQMRLQIAQGQLLEAGQLGVKGIAFVRENSYERLPVAAVIFAAAAEVAFERDRLAEAQDDLETAMAIGKYGGSLEYVRAKSSLEARLMAAQGRSAEAIQALDRACAEMQRLGAADALRELQAIRAGLLAGSGRADEAAAWLANLGADYALQRGYTNEVEALTRARVLIASGRPKDADEFLTGLEGMLDDYGRNGRLIEALILHSVARNQLGDRAGAQADLERAHALGDPQGYVRVFAGTALLPPKPAAAASLIPSADLAEALTPREVEVLRLVAEGLSNQQIASQLYLSLATVKKHTSSILGKLDTSNRTQAIARARQLGLL